MSSLGIKPVMMKPTNLASTITTESTTIVLNFLEDIGGQPITSMSTFGSKGVFTLSPKTSREEVISFTGFTELTNGKIQLSGITRGHRPVDPFDAAAEYAFDHPANSGVVASNAPEFYEQFISVDGEPEVDGQFTFNTTPFLDTDATDGRHAVNKAYVDNLVYGSLAQDRVTVNSAMVGEAVSARDVIYFDPITYRWRIADKTNTFLANPDALIGFAMEDAAVDTITEVMFVGTLPGFTGIVEGDEYFLDTAGAITNVRPDPATYTVIKMGTGKSTSDILMWEGPVNDKIVEALKGSFGVPSGLNKFVTEQSLGVFKYLSTKTFAEDDIVAYEGALWSSRENNNLGDTPTVDLRAPNIDTYSTTAGTTGALNTTHLATAEGVNNIRTARPVNNGNYYLVSTFYSTNNFVYLVPATTPYNPSTLNWGAKTTLTIPNTVMNISLGCVNIDETGTVLIVAGRKLSPNSYIQVNRYDLSTAWNMDTATYTSTGDITNGEGSGLVAISGNLEYIMFERENNNDYFDSAQMTTPGDPTTLVRITGGITSSSGAYNLELSHEGEYVIWGDNAPNIVYVQQLTTPGNFGGGRTTLYQTTSTTWFDSQVDYYLDRAGYMTRLKKNVGSGTQDEIDTRISISNNIGIDSSAWAKITN